MSIAVYSVTLWVLLFEIPDFGVGPFPVEGSVIVAGAVLQAIILWKLRLKKRIALFGPACPLSL